MANYGGSPRGENKSQNIRCQQCGEITRNEVGNTAFDTKSSWISSGWQQAWAGVREYRRNRRCAKCNRENPTSEILTSDLEAKNRQFKELSAKYKSLVAKLEQLLGETKK